MNRLRAWWEEWTGRAAGRRVMSDLEAMDAARRTAAEALAEERKHSARIYQALRAARAELQAPMEIVESDAAPPFDAGDRARLREFLGSPTGIRLKRNLNYWCQIRDQQATSFFQGTEIAYAAGGAKGFRQCADYLVHRLSADIRPELDENEHAGTGAAGVRERHAP